MDWDNKLKELQKPFNYSDIQWRVGHTNKDKTSAMVMAYVSNRAIQNRLDEVFGINGWRNEFTRWGKDSQLCGISIYNEDIKEWITKWDGADNTNFESTKGGLSNAMKRAAGQWGIGRYLYDMPTQWVDVEQKGKSVVIKRGCTPTLPSWAFDQGHVDMMKIGILEKKSAKKGVTEDKICAKYFKQSFGELNINEFKAISDLLEKYEDAKEGEEPRLKVKK